MNTTTITAYLLSAYINLSFTHSYILGYAHKGVIYAARIMDARPILPYIVTLDRASSKNGGTYSLKYKPSAAKWDIITTAAVEIKAICTVAYMEQMNAESKQNRGQIFEALVADAFHMTLTTRKNAKFTDCGDMVAADGIHYQVKFNKATFTDERTLKNLMS